MIGLDSNDTEDPKPTQSFNIIKVVHSHVYAIQFEYMADQQRLLSALSDYSLLVIDLNTMKSIKHIPNAHKKRINDIHMTENLLYSCSNDGTVKIWDIKGEKKPIAEFKDPAILEAYSLSQTGDTLAVGGNAIIQFWDMRNHSLLNTFDVTHSEEVSSLQFSKAKPDMLLSASLDGIICLSDISKKDEEEAAESVLRLDQPVSACNFSQNNSSLAYAQTTVQTIGILSLEEATQLQEVNPIENVETNEFSLLGVYDMAGDSNIYYLRGNLEGYIEEFAITTTEQTLPILTNKFETLHKGPIVKAQRLTDKKIISAGEDCQIFISENIEN